MNIAPVSLPVFPEPPTQLKKEECLRERKKVHEQHKRARRLESIDEQVDGVVHDLNNIVCIITAYAEFVSEAVTPDAVAASEGNVAYWADVEENVKTIQLAAVRGADLARQLLHVTNQPIDQLGPLDVRDILREVGRLLRLSLGENITLVTSVAPGTWPILVDPGQFERVLLNLAANARYAMKDGGVLTIDTQNVPAADPDDDMVQFRVTDTGTGMTPATLRHAFEPYFTTKPASEGTGLGLASVQRIVVDVGGTVEIASEPGQGTSISLTFPTSGARDLTRRDYLTEATGRPRNISRHSPQLRAIAVEKATLS
jgi:hypothetical protein